MFDVAIEVYAELINATFGCGEEMLCIHAAIAATYVIPMSYDIINTALFMSGWTQ